MSLRAVLNEAEESMFRDSKYMKRMRFEIISLFRKVSLVFRCSIIRRAMEAGQVEIITHNLRDFTHDKQERSMIRRMVVGRAW